MFHLKSIKLKKTKKSEPKVSAVEQKVKISRAVELPSNFYFARLRSSNHQPTNSKWPPQYR